MWYLVSNFLPFTIKQRCLRQYDTPNNLNYEKLNERKESHFKMIENIMDRNFWHNLET